MLPILKKLLQENINWMEIYKDNKEVYQYPGLFDSELGNLLYFVPDISKLPHYPDMEPHFIWSDIQKSTSKNKTTVKDQR